MDSSLLSPSKKDELIAFIFINLKSWIVKLKLFASLLYSSFNVILDTVLLSVFIVIFTPYSYNFFIGWFSYLLIALVWTLLVGQISKVILFFFISLIPRLS